ncbi:NAD(P)H-binding protein [Latilactobacillus sakei]|uniref:NmrA-like family protein n=1 Tax=Latilactobacillus sakei TaxID=1599 RepID=A0AAE8LW13_LATSK|nr:NAD(P)H-binding protein [Latilactobacillus sakei]AST83093.1 NAD-dependent dehydratase [Latilactobacillus sakei]MDN4010313.1 NAD(P)H-binding protein [Latilactobacillus sakei]MDR7923175.1 NAD(P)H-binding protein [Latilactobacillus sakei subsp. sakei]QGL60991.1 NAD(P)H-binding protein [Latilactobacillus sakei]USS39190.1 NAD(P)H-binding protein [Latilactobacillus sakei]
MEKVLILGAHGKIAQLTRAQLLAKTDAQLVLFLRKANRLTIQDQQREQLVEGDASQQADLVQAMKGVTVVYANLAGANIEAQAKTVVSAMKAAGVKRLIWISTLGIYDEVPGAYGQWNHQMLDDGYLPTYAAAAKVIETSGLAFTIIRPAWLSDKDEIDYEITHRTDTFKGTEVSRKSVAAEVVRLIQNPTEAVGDSLGLNKPNTDGDKPEWYR